MASVSSYPSIITLNINGLHSPKDTEWLNGLKQEKTNKKQKTRSNNMLPIIQRLTLALKGYT